MKNKQSAKKVPYSIKWLKSGMIVQSKNGDLGKVLLNTTKGDIVSGDGTHPGRTWLPLGGYTDEDAFGDYGLFVRVYDYARGDNIGLAGFNLSNFKIIWEHENAK